MTHKASISSSDIRKWEWDDHYDWPRDLIGYGEKSFNPQWLNAAKIAVSFVINYEEVNTLPNEYSLCLTFHLRAQSTQF
jgi:hypothetical protein